MVKTQTGQPQGIAPTVGDMVGTFKSFSTNEYIRGVKNKDWQRFNKKLWYLLNNKEFLDIDLDCFFDIIYFSPSFKD